MAGKIKDLDEAPPYRLTSKDFVDWHGSAMSGPAVVKVLDGQLDPVNDIPDYSPQRSINSATLHWLLSTPAAIAGVHRIAPRILQKL